MIEHTDINKRRYNTKETRTILLDAAETLFIKKGFSATSTNDISKLAGSSKSQVQYHFKSKKNLWKVVIERRLNQFFKAIEKLFKNIDFDKDNFKKGLETFFNFHLKNPQILSIIKWITIEGNPSDMHLHEEVKNILIKGIDKGKEDGLIRKELDPNYITYAILALVFHWFDMRGSGLDSGSKKKTLAEKDKYYLDTIIGIIYEGIFNS